MVDLRWRMDQGRSLIIKEAIVTSLILLTIDEIWVFQKRRQYNVITTLNYVSESITLCLHAVKGWLHQSV